MSGDYAGDVGVDGFILMVFLKKDSGNGAVRFDRGKVEG